MIITGVEKCLLGEVKWEFYCGKCQQYAINLTMIFPCGEVAEKKAVDDLGKNVGEGVR